MQKRYSKTKEHYINRLKLSVVIVAQFFFSPTSQATHLDKITLDVQLTAEEQQYLELKSVITHCSDPDWMPFSKNVNDQLIGITSDYVSLFSRTLEIPFEYVPSNSWKATLEKAKSRECDLVDALVNKPDRQAYLDFTRGYLPTSLGLATLSGAPSIDNLKALDGKTVAVVSGYASTAYLRDNYPNLVLKEVVNLDEGLRLVASGQTYGVAGTQAVLGYKIQNHYFNKMKLNGTFLDDWKQAVGTRKDEPILKRIMDKLVSAIPNSMHQHIFEQWLSESVFNRDPNDLTLSEMEFLTNHPVIRFQIRPNGAPFEFSDNGVAKGLAVDYLTNVANKLGFKAEYVVTDMNPLKAIAELDKDDRAFDSIAIMVKSEERSRQMVFGDVYLSYPMVIITNKNALFVNSLSELKSKTVVLEKGYLTNIWIASDYPDIKVINAVNSLEAIKMVNEGRADAYVGNLAIANYLMASGEMPNIKVAAPTEYGNVHFSFVAPNHMPELTSILSKGYRSISPSDHMVIREKWFTLQTIETRDYTLLAVVLTAATLLLLVSARWNSRVKREKLHTEEALEQLKQAQKELQNKNEELRFLSDTDSLTSLNNRAKIESILERELQFMDRYDDQQLSIIMIDIDKFKLVNDTYGHQTGDVVLKESSALFSTHIREVDFIGRWGGEEFMIVCPHTDKAGAIKLAENLRKLLSSHLMEGIRDITASFGVTTYLPDDSAESLIGRADKALYMSKDNGRNKVTYL
ncbi:transporter substrate-binding domain-containing protein [Vibrio hannami]|uniref:diguanylate cyclase n=1 Tax=Vibrio hannami TaxID=2717094 RepID=UPI00240EF3E5|nr:transporter substrate-binding domain-containing protein [Vibrio hannami]MDG3088157.1 transporter substrate-binding domain-containing protein [Vibrio hannami]